MAKQSYNMKSGEKLYLLELLEVDMRCSFPKRNDPRIKKALQLANELGLERVVKDIKHFNKEGYGDGRWFRDSEDGYNYVATLHKEPRSIGKKSIEFKKLADELLLHPQYMFADYNNHKKGVYE